MTASALAVTAYHETFSLVLLVKLYSSPLLPKGCYCILIFIKKKKKKKKMMIINSNNDNDC